MVNLEHLAKCTARLRKRSVPDNVESTAPKITWASAFNFLRQQGERVVRSTPFEIAWRTFRVISDIAYKRFVTDARDRTIGNARSQIASIIETAMMHVNDTDESIRPRLYHLQSLCKRSIEEVVAHDPRIG